MGLAKVALVYMGQASEDLDATFVKAMGASQHPGDLALGSTNFMFARFVGQCNKSSDLP